MSKVSGCYLKNFSFYSLKKSELYNCRYGKSSFLKTYQKQ